MRHPQPFGQLGNADDAAFGYQRKNLLMAFYRYHGSLSLLR